MGKEKIKVWIDIPTSYRNRKSSSGLSFGGKYIWVDKKKYEEKKNKNRG